MLPFILGYAAVLATLYGFGLSYDADLLRADPGSAFRLVLILVALPTAVACAVAEGAHAISPRRLLDHRVRAWFRRPVLSAISAVLTALAAAFVLPVVDGFVSDAVVLAASAAVFTLLPLAWQSQLRPGRCVRCGYDLRGLTSQARGRCPECGAAGSVYRGGGHRHGVLINSESMPVPAVPRA